MELFQSLFDYEYRINSLFDTELPLKRFRLVMPRFVKKGFVVNPEEYYLESSRDYSTFCCDGEYCLALSRFSPSQETDYSLAIVSYSLHFFGSHAVNPNIMQIQSKEQGTGQVNSHLAPIKWERLLVNMMIDLSREAGFKKILMTAAKNTPYYERRYGEGHYRDSLEAHQSRMRMRYDVTAKRMGFSFDDTEDVFVRNL